MSDAQNFAAPNPEVEHLQISMLSQALQEVALQNGRHTPTLALDGLLAGFMALAQNHPCCTAPYGHMAEAVGQELIAFAARRAATFH